MSELKPEAVAAVVSGKAMPEDIFTGESLAKYFTRKYLDMLAQRDMYLNAEISWEKAMMEAIGEDGVGSATKAIAELKAQRDALAENEGYMQAFYEMAEILGIGARADSPKNVFEQVIKPMLINLQKERDQLAAENAAIKTMNDVLSEELRGYESDGAYDGPIAHRLWHSNSETPATGAYLNSVRAEGVELASIELKELAKRSKSEAPKVSEHTHADALYLMLFAAKLRAGKDGEL